MDEDVLAALLGDEPIPLRVVEPLHAACCHAAVPLSWGDAPVFPGHHGRGAPMNLGTNKNAGEPGPHGVTFESIRLFKRVWNLEPTLTLQDHCPSVKPNSQSVS